MKSARRNFDTLISRFRAFIKPKLSPYHINNYLLIKNGIVSLQNCTVSSHRLLEFYDSGMKHAAADRWWQAGNDFYRAHRLWMQKEADLLPKNDSVHSYYTEVAEKYRHLCTVWSRKLFHKGQADFAEQLLENALQIAPDNRDTVAMLYNHYLNAAKAGKAAAVLSHYEKTLQDQEVTELTKEEIISSLHTSVSTL
jgi:tetratricopeptide (TPR) repeat protein